VTTVALVTGAGRGIGAACARRLAPTVDALLLADLDDASLAETTSVLRDRGHRCETVTGDLAAADTTLHIAERITALGTLRSVAHVAGISPTMAEPRRVFDVDLVATARLVDALRPLAQSGTALVCFASMAAHVGAADNAAADAAIDDPLAPDMFEAWAAAIGETSADPGLAYAWAKRGVQRLVRREAVALGPAGVRICSVSPGMVDTPMGRQEYAQQPYMKMLEEMTPLRRTASADELAAVVGFLCSDDASFVTGIDLLADGGVCAAIGAAARGI
jgi:NAD(P)-dependent dehydrogenase (short-subunit alcohol dehydrogenase family)